jgi:predicted transcriptional regulator
MRKLTEKQKQILSLIVEFPKKKGGTIRKWAKILGVSHVAVAERIHLIVKKGYLEHIEGEHNFDGERGYRVTKEGLEQLVSGKIESQINKKECCARCKFDIVLEKSIHTRHGKLCKICNTGLERAINDYMRYC